MNQAGHESTQELSGSTDKQLEQKYFEVFKPQPGAVRPGGRFEVFTLTDYSIPVWMTNSTGSLGR